MHLKRLELKGFKSFPNKTDIEFKEGITSIVGPNGSGKSNISDAIRWVLGEQSIKNLRGEKLEDVIFSGSDTKKGMNYCEVSIVIDNLDKKINLEFSEINIKRRAYKSGESEFFLNNKPCRLKDIKELFLDTGIGKDGYSIIEQGKVEEILSNNPQNRRKVFDEACKISKYRYKKSESERNLKNTKENLERINDIYIEIENQIIPLEIQQEKARKYLILKEELKEIEVNKYIIDIENVEKELENVNLEKENLDKKLEALQKEKNQIELNQNEENKKLKELEENIEKENQNINTFNSIINQKETTISVNIEKIKNIKENLIKNEQEFKNNQTKKEILKEELKKLENQKNTKNKNIKNLNSKKEDLKLNSKKEKLNQINEYIEKLKDESINILDKKQNLNSKLATFNANILNIDNREEVINKEIIEFEQNKNQKQENLKEIKTNLNKLESEINEKVNSTKNLKKLLIQKNEVLNEIVNFITKKKYLLNDHNSKFNIYEDIKNNHEGFNKGVKEVLKNKNLKGIYGALGEVITTKEKYEKAIENSLGAYMQNIIVEDESCAKDAINYLKKNNLGRVTFLPINVIKSNKIKKESIKSSVDFKILSELVEFDEKYRNIIENILGKVILVENIDLAIKFANETNHKFKVTTLDGDILNPGGSLTGGSFKNNSSILSRQRLLNELKVNIEKTKEEIKVLYDKKAEAENENIKLKSNLEKLEILEKENEKEILIKNSKYENIKNELEKLEIEIQKLKKEKDSLNDNFNIINSKKLNLEEEIIKFEDDFEKNKQNINQLTQKQANILELFENEKEKLDNLNLELVKEKQIYENICKDLEKTKKEIENINENLINLEKEKNSNLESLETLEKQKFFEIKEIENKKEILNNNLIQIQNKKVLLEKIKENIKQNEKVLLNIGRNFFDEKENLFKINSKVERLSYNFNLYTNELFEKYELTLVNTKLLKKEDFKLDKVKLEKLKKEIRSLGNVNIDSIKEYEEIKERYDFYKEQKIDLEESIESIEKLIFELEKNMKKEFEINFNNINKEFMEVYKTIFGGGYGELIIADKENILESDIEIISRPPGKVTKNLSLLSGGEKALTAISILFAIILTKPTPFCILDEIEAPLDDANIYRFGKFLKKLSKDTQFIAVTHRRGTMEASNFIYGVTMQEKGISKVVSLNLDEVSEITDII